MEAGTALSLRLHTRIPIPINTANSNTLLFQPRFTLSSHSPSSFSAYSYRGPTPKRPFLADWVSQNDDVVRTLPIYVGSASLFAILLNRSLSGIAPVVDAGRHVPSLSLSLSLALCLAQLIQKMHEIEFLNCGLLLGLVCLSLFDILGFCSFVSFCPGVQKAMYGGF